MALLATSSPPFSSRSAAVPTSTIPQSHFLTPLVLFIHGYHPFAGDAGIYTAGVRHILNPALDPRNAVFVTAFNHRSVFPWILAALTHLTHLPLPWILLAIHLLSVRLFLTAAVRLAERLFPSPSAPTFSVLLAAAACALPVAGTALVLMDPYVTARSLSTPLSLLAVAAALDRRWSRTLLLLILALAVHPLMGAYAVAFILVLALLSIGRIRTALLLCATAFLLAGTVFFLAHNAPADPAYRQALFLSPRSFLFLARWRWYEVLGLLLPLLLFALPLRRLRPESPTRFLCLSAIFVGTTALLVAACFAPPAGPYPLIPFQVLRCFHLIYAVGVILCGGVLAVLARRAPWFPVALLVLLFTGMFLAQNLAWPGNRRLEFPGLAPANPYTQAFLWIRTHTPANAVFAFNPQLVYLPGEDEQGFRVLSERDQLADDKDAGVAAVIPSLAPLWASQRNPEFSVDAMSDPQRLATLIPLGATWLLLPRAAPTHLPCPYRNPAVQVCRLQP